jgi:uncharacterized glyoxalase superfamily protein PhnB
LVVRITSSAVVLAVNDLERAADWFVNVLGFARSDPDPGAWAFLTREDATFMLGNCPDATPASKIGDHSYIAYLTVDAVDDFHAQAVAADAKVIKAPRDEPWGMREMALRTPDGHRIMVGQRL